MIVAMKHLTVLAIAGQKKQAVRDLEQLGVLHVEINAVTSNDIEVLKQKESQYRQVIALIVQNSPKKPKKPSAVEQKFDDLDLEIVELLKRGEALKNARDANERVVKEVERLSAWGQFDPKTLSFLKEKGFELTLAVLSASDEKQIKGQATNLIVGRPKGKLLIANLDSGLTLPVQAERVVYPELSLNEFTALDAQQKIEMKQIQAEIASKSAIIPHLEARIDANEHLLVVASVEASLDSQEKLVLASGFMPVTKVDLVKAWAHEKAWGIVLRDPIAGERVPTVLKNKKPFGLIKPVLDFLGTLPGYEERDISPYFLLFMIIFFAMIIGDAVYGLLLLGISILVAIKSIFSRKPVPAAIKLLAVFSVATTIWGAMNGTWLGLESVKQIPFFNYFMIPAFVSPETGTRTLMFLCFTIGLVHLTLAHLLKFIREIRRAPHIHALAQIGWTLVINASFFLVLSVVIDPKLYPVPVFVPWFIGIGMGLVFLFESQTGDGFFKGVLRAFGGVITTALNGVSAFADVISYVRLFAVGLAGIAIETSFNSMAAPMLNSGDAAVIGGVLIMLFGHSLNLVMGALSVIVHGIRLNMLEFSNHIGLEWSGFNYKPFKEAGAEKS